jgi:hypothetical protein
MGRLQMTPKDYNCAVESDCHIFEISDASMRRPTLLGVHEGLKKQSIVKEAKG